MSADPQRQWGILLASRDDGGPLEGAVSACASALDRGAKPFLYLLHDGTRHVHHPTLQRMRAEGLRLYCCSFSARKRGIETDDAAIYCGLGVLADILASVDRFLSFTGSRWDGREIGEDAPSAGERRVVQLRVWSDPEVSDFAAEGIRVALGLLSSGRLGVQLVFGGPGVKCLRPEVEKTLEGVAIATHLQSFKDGGGEFHVCGKDAPLECEGCFGVLGF